MPIRLASTGRFPGRRTTAATPAPAPARGPECGDGSHYVRVCVAQLRHEVEADPGARYLRTEPGVGYRLVSE